MKVCDFFKNRAVYGEDREVGVEVELSGSRLPNHVDGWRVEVDGSVPDGLEYVMEEPRSLAGTRASLAILKKGLIDSKAKVKDSVKAGVHIHVNLQHDKLIDVFKVYTLYYLFEDCIVRWCGESRVGNLFCLRASDALDIVQGLSEFARTLNKDIISNDDFRYTALNPESLHKYGTLEFRAMRGTDNIDDIYDITKLLVRLKRRAVEFNTPSQILTYFSEVGCKAMYDEVFGEFGSKFWYDGLEGDVMGCLENAQQVGFCCDWGEFEHRFHKKSDYNNPFAKAVINKENTYRSIGGLFGKATVHPPFDMAKADALMEEFAGFRHKAVFDNNKPHIIRAGEVGN